MYHSAAVTRVCNRKPSVSTVFRYYTGTIRRYEVRPECSLELECDLDESPLIILASPAIEAQNASSSLIEARVVHDGGWLWLPTEQSPE